MKIRKELYDTETEIFFESRDSEKVLGFVSVKVVDKGSLAGTKFLVIEME